MNINEDNAGLILNALGLAVVDLIISGTPISRDNPVERLERTRHETGNVIGKGGQQGCGGVGAERAIKNPARWPGWFKRPKPQNQEVFH